MGNAVGSLSDKAIRIVKGPKENVFCHSARNSFETDGHITFTIDISQSGRTVGKKIAVFVRLIGRVGDIRFPKPNDGGIWYKGNIFIPSNLVRFLEGKDHILQGETRSFVYDVYNQKGTIGKKGSFYRLTKG